MPEWRSERVGVWEIDGGGFGEDMVMGGRFGEESFPVERELYVP